MDSKPEVKNPQAFPVATHAVVRPGMTLRDYFAGRCYSSAAKLCFEAAKKSLDPKHATADEIARVSYVMSDAMLKARGDG